jgi:hypothetical protein
LQIAPFFRKCIKIVCSKAAYVTRFSLQNITIMNRVALIEWIEEARTILEERLTLPIHPSAHRFALTPSAREGNTGERETREVR